ncbi:MAG TPA: hypothetical protein VH643_23430 [Gemmataceae bacterium]|jgi:hypothetical protein
MNASHEREITKAVPWEEVLKKELEQIDTRRQRLGQETPQEASPPPKPDGVEKDARRRDLVGLAFSGGGIRSATFNLGLLQGLASLKLLPLFDYLSTVSGGGYIGSWLTAWIQRPDADLGTVQTHLANGVPPQPGGAGKGFDPVGHLRRYSNYLAPRQGFLSADVWGLWASYLRNFLLNQFALLPSVVVVLLVVRLVMLLYYPWSPEWKPSDGTKLTMAILAALIFLAWGGALVVLLRGTLRVLPPGKTCPAKPDGRLRPGLLLAMTLLLLMGAVLFCAFAPYRLLLRDHLSALGLEWLDGWAWVADLASFALPCALLGACSYFLAVCLPRKVRRLSGKGVLLTGVGAGVVGFLGGALLYGVYLLLHQLYTWDGMEGRDYLKVRATAEVMTLGPPLVALAFVLAFCITVAVLKRLMTDELREWWSCICARLLAAAAVWLVVTGVALFAPPLVLWAGPWLGAALGSGWLGTVIAGVFAGRGPRTGDPNGGFNPLEWLTRLAPSLFLAGLLVLISLVLHWTLDNRPNWRAADERIWLRQSAPERPPIRVIASQTSEQGKPASSSTLQTVTERDEVVSDARIVQQMYWASLLNTKREPRFVPHVECYRLSRFNLEMMQEEGHLSHEHLISHLESIRGKRFSTREEFEAELDRLLPPDVPYMDRMMVLQHATQVKSMEFSGWKLLGKLLAWLAVTVVVLIVAVWGVDVNLFSLHAVYRNRLIRCYLGASRSEGAEADPKDSPRWPDPLTEFDPNDDLRLAQLRPSAEKGGYDGPFLLVNTAMNLVRGDRLDWQERKAEAFVLTPLYCGSPDTKYRPTQGEGADERTRLDYGGDLSLGTAMALSGAAASPNMGYHSSPAVTALLTVFNARLGGWLGNPASPTRWMRAGPPFGFFYLFRELFGWTRAKGAYVYLSDGGHFENLGAYELVRRRCRHIIVSDAGQDGQHSFEDLGNLIHKCRVDFGIEIEIDLRSLRRDERGRCRWHCAVGQIRYDLVDPESAPGTLVYIKPSLTGDEPADVLHQAESAPAFPHDPTTNQFYNESQFESYRALGRHIAETVFKPSAADMEEELFKDGALDGGLQRRQSRALFASLVRRWFAMPPAYESNFVTSTNGFLDIQESLRRDTRLRRLTFDLYPELEAQQPLCSALPKETPAEQAERCGAELHVILQMLQVMENAWLSLNLDVYYAHPLNRGWMDVFHRWTSAKTVRWFWPLLRSEMARGFVSFCEKQMKLGEVKSKLEPIQPTDAASPDFERIRVEFQDQWPKHYQTVLTVPLGRIGQNGKDMGWWIFPQNTYPLSAPPPAAPRVPFGIILVSPAEETETYNFLVWMRGAYRNSGLGRFAVQTALREIAERLAKGETKSIRLRVRLPVENMNGPGGELQKQMWMTFFFNHGFVRVTPPPPSAGAAMNTNGEETEIILERVLTGVV